MQAAQGGGLQKQLGFWLQAELPSELKHGQNPDYPSRAAVSRWASGEDMRMPAAALVLAMLKVLEEGGSIDELLGGATSRMTVLEGRLEELADHMAILQEEVNRARRDRGERALQFPKAT